MIETRQLLQRFFQLKRLLKKTVLTQTERLQYERQLQKVKSRLLQKMHDFELRLKWKLMFSFYIRPELQEWLQSLLNYTTGG